MKGHYPSQGGGPTFWHEDKIGESQFSVCIFLDLPITSSSVAITEDATESMAVLVLSPTKRHFGFGDKDDFVVLDGRRVIGRIFVQPQAPEGRPWFWTITASDIPPSIEKRGYSATREEAMADFKALWADGG